MNLNAGFIQLVKANISELLPIQRRTQPEFSRGRVRRGRPIILSIIHAAISSDLS